MTVLTRLFPLLPIVAAILSAAALLVVVWIAPATAAGTAEKTVHGTARFISWENERSRSQTMEWSYTVNVDGDPSEVAILPRMLYSFKLVGGDDAGNSELEAVLRVYINDVEAYRYRTGATLDLRGGGYTYFTDSGVPDNLEDIRGGLLHRGDNQIRLAWDLGLTVKAPGTTGRYDITLGPVHSYLYQADGDGDGVVDAHQLVRTVHTGFIAIPAALLGGGAAFFGIRGAVRKWFGPSP